MVGSTFESVQVILMTIDEILAGESKNVEFKVQRPEKSIKYMKTVIAFANGKGGQIIFGIDDKTRNIVGIPEEEQEKIFGEFARLSGTEKEEGFGLGLSIADQLARGLGGSIALCNAPAGGAVVIVKLPLTGQLLRNAE